MWKPLLGEAITPYFGIEGESLLIGARRNYSALLIREKRTLAATDLDPQVLHKEVQFHENHVLLACFMGG